MIFNTLDFNNLKDRINSIEIKLKRNNILYWNDPFLISQVEKIFTTSDMLFINLALFDLVNSFSKKNIEITNKLQKNSDILSGKILIYSPSHSMADCLAQAETSFFNRDDMPDPTSWICYIYQEDEKLGYLLSWIPNEIIPLVQNGIDVSIGSLFWADDLENIRSYDDYLYYFVLNLKNIIQR